MGKNFLEGTRKANLYKWGANAEFRGEVKETRKRDATIQNVPPSGWRGAPTANRPPGPYGYPTPPQYRRKSALTERDMNINFRNQ